MASSKKHKVLGTKYYRNVFGHLYARPAMNSHVMTIVTCGMPLKVYSSNRKLPNKWHHVIHGKIKGYVYKKFLSDEIPRCLNRKYPKFFDKLNLSDTEIFLWGRLYDQYQFGHTRVRGR